MKELTMLLLIFGSSVLSYALEKQKCCENDEIMKLEGFCGIEPIIRMNCTDRRILLKNIILSGNKVSTVDQPNITFVEDVTQYCIGRMYQDENRISLGVIPIALVCWKPISDNSKTIAILSIISVFFLAATLATYTCLPEMRDPKGLCYMCLCISMAIAFLAIGVIELSPHLMEKVSCAIGGAFQYFWMMATFFWMNVTCINMYLKFRNNSKTDIKLFMWYNCYAWGSPLLLLSVSLIVDFIKGDHWKPGIKPGHCFFSGKTESWIFFLGPTTALIFANVVLFILTSYNFLRVMNSLNIPRNFQKKFFAILKLFLIMGIPWIFKVASFIHGQPHIVWEITDIFNCLQGVVMFITLVDLRKIVQRLA